MWAYGIPCPAMVSPNVKQQREDMLLYPDHYLVWYAKVDSGPHSEKVMFSVLAVCSLGVSHVTNTWLCSNLFTSDPPVSTLVHPHPHEDFSTRGPLDMFEFVHYETHSVVKRAVAIRLKCLLVNDYVHMEFVIFYNIFMKIMKAMVRKLENLPFCIVHGKRSY